MIERSAAAVAAWLRQNGASVRSLSQSSVDSRFGDRRFVRGWSFNATVDGQAYELQLLLSPSFPSDQVRIAAPENLYLKFAHVDSDGIVCGPPHAFSTDAPVENAKSALQNALHLLAQPPAYHHSEFEREFVSYWNQNVDGGTTYTLFDPEGPARHLLIWTAPNGPTFAGDSSDGLRSWLKNLGHIVQPEDLTTGLYLPLVAPPTPPLINDTHSFMAWLDRAITPQAATVLAGARVLQDRLHFVLSARVDDRIGLIGASLIRTSVPKHGGFRKGKANLAVLRLQGTSKRTKIKRGDPSWVHGRDTNENAMRFANATATIIGCGALGSHVAVRLAQAGVGSFRLIEPEDLETANVGRHALGMESVGRNKATALERYLRSRFPHLKNVESITKRWERMESPDEAFAADVVVCTTGEPGPELLLNVHHLGRGAIPPVVYGWMEARAVAAHAVAIVRPTHCLRCFLRGDGHALHPEAEWTGGGDNLVAEPACGTFFQPFGPVDLGRAEALVSDAVIDVLRGKLVDNAHRVWATSNDRLTELDGTWSDKHMEMRPEHWVGRIEFDRPLPPPTACAAGIH